MHAESTFSKIVNWDTYVHAYYHECGLSRPIITEVWLKFTITIHFVALNTRSLCIARAYIAFQCMIIVINANNKFVCYRYQNEREKERSDNERNFHIRCFIKLVDRYFSNNYRQGKGKISAKIYPFIAKVSYHFCINYLLYIIQLVVQYIYIYMANLMDQCTCIKAFFFFFFSAISFLVILQIKACTCVNVSIFLWHVSIFVTRSLFASYKT